jgi:hypothetical protein
LKAHDHPNKKSMSERKVILGFKFILSEVEKPRDEGNVNAQKNQH